MKKLLYYKDFLNEHKKINEGGGAGINFSTDINVIGVYTIEKDKLKVVDTDVELSDSFNAHGYMEGMDNVTTKLLKIDSKKLENPSLEILQNIRFKFDVHNDKFFEILDYLDIKVSDDIKTMEDAIESLQKRLSITEELKIKHIFKLNPEAKFDIIIELSGEYESMKFAGYVRGGFEEGDIVFESQDANIELNTKLNTEEDSYEFWLDESFKEFNNSDRLTNYFMPELKATKDFVTFYNTLFKNYTENVIIFAINQSEYILVDDDKILQTSNEKSELDESKGIIKNVNELTEEEIKKYDYEPTEEDYFIFDDYLKDVYGA